ncbi:MAG: site-specific DNA-methyltransferase [Acetobacteraceae bacterium]
MTAQTVPVAWPADQTERWPLARLAPYQRNARTHSDEQVAQIAASIQEFGFTNPVLVDETGTIIAGHGRVLAAHKAGLPDVPVMVARGWSQAQIRAYLLADNKLALNAGWDTATLALELGELQAMGFDLALTGFSDDEIADLLTSPEDQEPTADGDEDDPADTDTEVPATVVTRPGDLWLLGEHRLLCGDSTDRTARVRLMDGDRASLLFTSPPYGNQRNYTTGGIGDWDVLMRGVFTGIDEVMTPDGQVLVNLGMIHRDGEWQPYWQGWLDWMRTEGWRRFGLYCWDQGPGLPGDWNGRLAPSFELIFHFNRASRHPNKIVPCRWAGHVNSEKGGLRGKDGTVGEWTHAGQGVQDMRIPDNVIRITRHKARGIETEHPAVFPVKLPEFLMQAYTDAGDIVFEPFSGSGTTILAGQRAERRVRAMELAPEYVDLAITRWRLLHPDEPVTLADDGRSYDEVAAERTEAEVADAA